MSFIYLICTTIFGFLSALFLLVFFVASKKSIIVFVIFSIFAGLTTLFYKLYGKRKRKAAAPPIVEKTNIEKEAFLAYARENEQVLKTYSKEVDDFLINYYHFKTSYRPQFLSPAYPEGVHADTWLHKEGHSPQKAAQIIFDEIAARGNDGSPEIFTITYSSKTLPRYYKFNKMFFGSYNPPAKTVVTLLSVFMTFGFMFYALPQVFFGPNYDLFLPSEEWKDIALGITWALTILMGYFMFQSKDYKQRLQKQHGKMGSVFISLIVMPVIFFMFYITFQIGMPKFLNEAIGTEQTQSFMVTKDMETSKRAGKHSHVDAYCVKVSPPDGTFFANEYCIKKEHYDQLSDTSAFVMKFNGKGSVFGFRIQGYFEEM